DVGLRDLLRLDARDEVAVLVLDGVDRAVDAADGAVDAALGVDVVLPLGGAPDGVGRALDLADAAPDAFVSDEMRHAVGPESLPDARHHRTSVEAERLDAMFPADDRELARALLADPDERRLWRGIRRPCKRAPARMNCLLGRKGDGIRASGDDGLEIEVAAGDDALGTGNIGREPERGAAVVVNRAVGVVEDAEDGPDRADAEDDGPQDLTEDSALRPQRSG